MPVDHSPRDASSLRARVVTSILIAAATSLAMLSLSAPPTADAAGRYHEARKGDSLSAIADRYRCDLKDVRKVNRDRIKDDVVHPGDKVIIPTTCGEAHAATPRESNSQGDDPGRYVIEAGDTLGGIAAAHECSVAELRRANRLRGDVIHPGKTLKIPACGEGIEDAEPPKTRVAAKPRSKRSVEEKVSASETPPAVEAQVSPRNPLIKSQGESDAPVALPTAAVERTPKPAAAKTSSAEKDPQGTAVSSDHHVVAPGQTLGAIADSRGCAVRELLDANPGVKADLIHPGQRLVVPGCTGVTKARSWSGVNSKILPRLMRRRGFRAPKKFKAMVIEVSFDRARRRIVDERVFDYKGTSDDRAGWNPASTIKLFAVIAATQRARQRGFSPAATVTFHGAKSRQRFTLQALIESTLIDSDNLAYNRLVQLAGFDYLNGRFLTPSNGFASSALMRAYQQGDWRRLGESISFRQAPRITLREGDRTHTIKPSNTRTTNACAASACTTLRDLAEGMRRLMLQEQLPADETFRLKRSDLVMIRQAMRAHRERGNEVIDAFADVFNDDRMMFYSKPGFSNGWFSDNVYIYDPTARQAWIVVMAGAPGRKSLNHAARIIAEIIKAGELRESAP